MAIVRKCDDCGTEIQPQTAAVELTVNEFVPFDEGRAEEAVEDPDEVFRPLVSTLHYCAPCWVGSAGERHAFEHSETIKRAVDRGKKGKS